MRLIIVFILSGIFKLVNLVLVLQVFSCCIASLGRDLRLFSNL